MKYARLVLILAWALPDMLIPTSLGQEASKTTTEAPPTAEELLQRILALQQQMLDQQQRHDAEIQSLKAEIEQLKSRPAEAGGTGQAPEQELSAEQELEAALSGVAPPTQESPQPSGLLAAIQGAPQSFNPDISLNADFLAAYSNREGGELDDEFLFRELEMSFSAPVDAYSRADFFVSLEREDEEFHADLEEGYLTLLALPYDLQARFGKFRAEFGRANPTHRHALPWVDYPLVLQRYFGEETLLGTGAEISWLVPNPWKMPTTLIYEVFNNDNDSMFAGEESDDFVHLVRLKTFKEITDTANVELGTSFATAPNDALHGGDRAYVQGFDLTYRWKPKEAGKYQSFLWQNEVLFAQADQEFDDQQNTWGMYTAPEYQFARRWKLGIRYDHAEMPNEQSQRENGYSAYLTFLQSEFVYWRLGYMFTDRNFLQDGNDDEHQVFVQLNWNLGVHPAHKF